MSFSHIDATSSTLLSIVVSFNLFICVLMIQYDAYSLLFDKPSAPRLSSLLLPLQTLRYSSIHYTFNSLLLSSFTSISTPFNSHIIVSSEDIEYFYSITRSLGSLISDSSGGYIISFSFRHIFNIIII